MVHGHCGGRSWPCGCAKIMTDGDNSSPVNFGASRSRMLSSNWNPSPFVHWNNVTGRINVHTLVGSR